MWGGKRLVLCKDVDTIRREPLFFLLFFFVFMLFFLLLFLAGLLGAIRSESILHLSFTERFPSTSPGRDAFSSDAVYCISSAFSF